VGSANLPLMKGSRHFAVSRVNTCTVLVPIVIDVLVSALLMAIDFVRIVVIGCWTS
jgi:hypothetical protein